MSSNSSLWLRLEKKNWLMFVWLSWENVFEIDVEFKCVVDLNLRLLNLSLFVEFEFEFKFEMLLNYFFVWFNLTFWLFWFSNIIFNSTHVVHSCYWFSIRINCYVSNHEIVTTRDLNVRRNDWDVSLSNIKFVLISIRQLN